MITSSPPDSSPNGPLFGSSASRRSAGRVYTRRTATTASSSAAKSSGSRNVSRRRDIEDEDDEDTETEGDEDEATVRSRGGAVPGVEEAARSKESLTKTPATSRPGKKRKLEDKTPSADDITPTARRTRSGTLGRAISTPTLGSAIKANNKLPADGPLGTAPDSPPSPTKATSRPQVLPTTREAPQTPPSQRIRRTISDGISPRNLAQQFSMTTQSPGSPGRLSAGGSPRPRLARMLTKTQSLGSTSSPSRPDEDHLGRFGSAMSPLGAGAMLTPGKLSRQHSMPSPSTPSRTPGRTRLLDEGEDGTAMPGTMFLQERDRSGEPNTGSGGRAKRVYGRSRTMLADSVNVSPRSGAITGADDVARESYKELRKKFEVDNSGEDIAGDVYADLLAARNGQSVSDLKSKGENRRFMDQLGYLVEPVTDPSSAVSLRRSGALKLLNKSQDSGWLDRLKMCGQVEKVWEAIHQVRDEIVETICLLYVAVLLQSGSGIESILSDDSVVNLAVGMLNEDRGPLDEGYVGKVNSVVSSIRASYGQLDMQWSQTSTNTRRLASYVLSRVSSADHYSACGSALSSVEALRRTMRSLKAETDILRDRKDMAIKGLPLLDPNKPADVEHIRQCVEVVSHLISESADDAAALAVPNEPTANCLSDASGSALHLALHDPDVGVTAARIVFEVLQIFATLITASSDWATYIGRPTMLVPLARILLHRDRLAQGLANTTVESAGIDNPFTSAAEQSKEAGEEKDTVITGQDLLCLVLALLTTGSLQLPEMLRSIAVTSLSPMCAGLAACFSTCTCAHKASLASLLVDLYISCSEDSAAVIGAEDFAGGDVADDEQKKATATGFIRSYTAILIAKLVSAASTMEGMSQSEILDPLPGEGSADKLKGLLVALSELGGVEKHVRVVSGRTGGDVDGADAKEGEDSTVQGVMEELRGVMREVEAGS